MMEQKKIVNDKSQLFVRKENKPKFIRASPDSDEFLKVWIKEPTWLQVEQALNTVLNLDAKNQNVDLDLNAMYRYMVNNFIDRTEPSLTTVDLLRLTPFVGNQLKEILPNPFGGNMGDEEGKAEKLNEH